MFSLESISKIPRPELKTSRITALALGSGAGAAVGSGILPWYWLLPVLLLFFIMIPKIRLFFAIGLVACGISGICHKIIDDINAAKHPPAGVISGELLCTDRRTSALPELPPPEIMNCQISSKDATFNAAVILPAEQKRILYGEKFRFTGKVFPAKPSGLRFDGANFTGEMPPLYGKRALLIVDKAEKLPGSFSFFTPFFAIRDKLLARLLAHVDDPEIRSMAAKMFFSASTVSSRRLNNDFIISGTIHIFSVSGLHVTVLAGMLLLLLKFIPFQWRYRITAAIIPLYVLCTGASLPAIRAGVMIVVWCIMRSMLFYSPGWNAMMLTWTLFALLAPETVASIGAQYSFGITGALLLLLEKLKILRHADRAITDMMPQDGKVTASRRKYLKHKYRFLSTVLISVVAFAASSGISMRRQHLFLPGSIAANCLMPLLTPLLFGAFIFKLLCFALPDIIDRFGAWILTSAFKILTATVSAMAEIFAPVPAVEPPLWLVALFYILFFTALSRTKSKVTLACTAVCTLILWIMPLLTMNLPGKIMVINHGSGTPALLAYIPHGRAYAEIVDVPDSACGALAGRELLREGVQHVRVGFSRGIRNNSAGMRALARQLPCTAFPPEGKRKNSAAFLRNLQNENIFCRDIPAIFKIEVPQKNHITWQTADGTVIHSESTVSGRRISVIFRNGEIRHVTLPWCSLPVVWSTALPADCQQHDAVDNKDQSDTGANQTQR